MYDLIKDVMWRSFNGDAEIKYDCINDLYKVKLVKESCLTERDFYTILEEKRLKLNKIYVEDERLVIEVRFK